MDFLSYLEWIPEPLPGLASGGRCGPTLPRLPFTPVAECSFLLLEPVTLATTPPGFMLADPPDWNVLSPNIHKVLALTLFRCLLKSYHSRGSFTDHST